jgi:hypothetical protein
MSLRIGVVGNCQAIGFATSIATLTGANVEVLHDRLILAGTDQGYVTTKFDLIFTQPHDERFGPFSTESLKSSGQPVVVFPYIIFPGLHPDCHYFSVDGRVVPAPTYHSAIVAASFLENIPECRVARLFNAFTYASLGYFDSYAQSTMALSNIFRKLGFDADRFLSKGGAFMHSINHPKIDFVFDVAKQALSIADIPFSDDCEVPVDPLAKATTWPIYPELAERLNLEGGFTFKLLDGTPVDLKEYISRSYEGYREYGKHFTSGNIERARRFISNEIIK